MLLAACSRKPREYILKDHRKLKDHPTFTIRALTPLEKAHVSDALSGGVPISYGEDGEAKQKEITITLTQTQMIQQRIETLKFGLVNREDKPGWVNLKDGDGDELPFSIDNIEFLSSEALEELAEEINPTPTEEKEKNSGK